MKLQSLYVLLDCNFFDTFGVLCKNLRNMEVKIITFNNPPEADI